MGLPASATHQKNHTTSTSKKNNQRHLLGWSLADEFKTPDAISRKNPWAVSTGGRKFRHVKGRKFTPPSHTKCLSLAKCHPPLSRLRNTGEVKSWATPDHYRKKVFLNATPSINWVSCRLPPWTFLMPIMLSGMSSSRRLTASTTMLEKRSRCWLISFDDIAVAAHLTNCDLLSSSGMLTARSLTRLTAILAAFRNPLTTTRGCTPSSMKDLHCFKNSPARMTTDVVPSPTSAS